MSSSQPRRRILVTGGSGFIGSYLVGTLREGDRVEVINVDLAAPKLHDQFPYWVEGDVRDVERLKGVFSDFRPTDVVHMAARIDMGGASLADYSVNTDGTSNLIEAITNTKSIERALFVSSQFVCQPGHVPLSDEDYMPHTIYGQSKVMAERSVRNSTLRCSWVILRPTTVWGPGDIGYRRDFYRTIRRGLYLHPRGKSCRRSYGFVGNVVSQICFFLDADPDAINQATFYLGDPIAEVAEFAQEFSRQLRGRDARIVPAAWVHAIAKVGDVATGLGLRFPLTTSRYESMTKSYPVPIEPTIALTGSGPYSLEAGVRETVAWLKTNDVI